MFSVSISVSRGIHSGIAFNKTTQRRLSPSSLGASNGASQKVEGIKPNMTEAEHRELWAKYQK